ncbi:MAG: aminotransferase class I/II-fold pyridoxal phosphate-dependent enzyme [Syntrophorhabdus sp.]
MKRDIPDIHEFSARTHTPLRRIMDFTTTINPVGPPEKAKAAIRKSLKVIDRPYDRRAGYLVRAIARSCRMADENILVCDSFHSLVAGIARTFQLGTILCYSPYPLYYKDWLELPVNTSFVMLDPGDGYSLNLQEWENRLEHCDAAVISYPSFISREIPSRDDILRLIARAVEKNVFIIIDETLIGFSAMPSLSADVAGYRNCLVVKSLTEYYSLAGLPVSYASGPAETIGTLTKSANFFVPGTLACAAATQAIRDKEYGSRTRVFFEREAGFIERNLAVIPGVTYFRTACSFYIVDIANIPAGSLDAFRRYRILVDDISSSGTLFFPVKNHKWNARYIKTLKNIMGAVK